ncbi:multi-sensor signal transduction histidine kinase [Calothrix sp. NIES-2100]|uniref:trifunctional serine/threonine-protein kinase/ATP-binding protein/sensor histidine kinase n=1 Tax=Calothrix sp. NIES-2100 TaxID=1954172 RepID=UPI000B615D73|nr:multi-sensor signal transduction histidine kinase [Calothrix sp. NIES-2100]
MSPVIIPGYKVSQELYNGSRTLVYRGYREIDRTPVVIKLLKNPYPSFSELLQFRNQYTIAQNLDIPGIVRFLGLEPYRNSYALVMQDFGGISLKQYAQQQLLSVIEILEIALQLTDIFHALYQNRVIHKDIKPANILIHPETKQVKLIDFSIASLLTKETQEIRNPNGLEGTLGYLSPEQTGRMNRGIDYRSDFYSFGVTLYELLTGQLPFNTHEPMELVHCHLAKMPDKFTNEKIPQVLGDIVLKLMAKKAEERYQSALGLKFDLEKCLVQLRETGTIAPFSIGERDLSDRFIIPEKLYGRENEVQELLNSFERVALGNSELMLVAGFSGIGKTAVVNEIHKPIVRQRGYFIKGKFDQFNRNIPLNAFVQAFRNLMEQILTQSDRQIAQWKDKILGELGESGQVIIEVIPELELIIGQQPSAPELSGTAAQNRFNLLFSKFIQVFTTKEHPLVIFLDDLQWADAASLKLLQLLIAEAHQGYLLLIGAYRDNEVSLAHPLILILDEMSKKGAKIQTITLHPLSHLKLNQLVADTLACREELAFPLSKLVYQKTQGNPFFSTQFLKALHQDGLIEFTSPTPYQDGATGGWQCDIVRINQQALTDDVVEFMAWQLQKLPESTQEILQLAACIGNKFDLKALAIVSQLSELETAACLWKALQEGLILPQSEVYKFYQQESFVDEGQQITITYKFLHDRVQQAAYFLIPDDQKPATHLKIGQLLLKNTKATAPEENLLEIVNQLNIGKFLIIERSQQIQLAGLNLQAGKKARVATAYTAALEYATTGIYLLNCGTEDSGWETQYDLTLALYELATETAYLSGDFSQMEQFANIVLPQAKTSIDKMKVFAVKIQAEIAQANKLQAVKFGLEALALVGVTLPESPDSSDIQQALIQTASYLEDKNIAELINLPLMIDMDRLAASRMLNSIGTAIYQAVPEMFPLVICKLVNLSINYGNSVFSSYGYACYGILLNEKFQDIESAYQFSKLALNLSETFNAPEMKASAFLVAGCSTIYGKVHIKETLPIFWESYQSGLESGNLEFVGYAAVMKCQNSYLVGQELTVLAKEMATSSHVLEQFKQEHLVCLLGIFQQVVINLLNPSAEPCSFQGKICDEKTCLLLLNNANDRTGIFQFYFNKLMLCYLFGESAKAWENTLLAAQYLDATQGTLLALMFHFYDSLAHLAIYSSVPDSQQEDILSRVANNQQKLKLWADHAPMNFLHKFDLVEAERERVQGNKAQAIEFYDRAIVGAKQNEYIQEEAIANELAAKFYLDWGKERIAKDYLIAAYYGYARWGAKAKVADLEQRYPELLATILQQSATAFTPTETVYANENRLISQTSTSGSSSSSVSTVLDLSAVLKASQNLSSQIQLDKLLTALLEIVIATAGADKCVLILLNHNQLHIEAVAQVGKPPVVLQSIPLSASEDLPVSLVYTVKRTLQPIVIIDATVHPSLLAEPYVLRQQPQSVLCTPILHQGKLLGVLYLENNLATGAFTSDRIELLNLLCTQAAISLENARLYQNSQNYAKQLAQSLANLQESEIRFQNLANNIPGMVYQFRLAVDGSTSTPYVSSGCLDLYELEPEAVMAGIHSLYALHHPDDHPTLAQALADSAQNLTPFVEEWRIILPSKSVKWIQSAARPTRQADGVTVWDGVVIDISDRKQAEVALQQKSSELEQALNQLQNAQLQIVQSEKMSALGNLVAGVAHEMNNPLGFIAASLKQAKPTIADITEHLKLYQQTYQNKSESIIDHAESIDLDYTLEDVPKIIDAMVVACDRLKNISTSLRTFSRADKDYKVPFNIHQGIDSTILILKHRLKANEQRPAIEVLSKYGDLPAVECFPGQLNQVFMNILANAIDAVEEANHGRSYMEIQAHPNVIRIKTSLESQQVKITITDNGIGMSVAVKEKVFDHLFTTKGVNKGTGLGLAIAKQIVEEKHGGKLSCNSIEGEGTEFILEIPL